MNEIQKNSLVNALGVALYVVFVAVLMNSLMGKGDDEKVFVPIFVLMLLVLSASVVGSLIFAKPVMMYINGQKTDSVKMLVWTLAWIAIFTALAMIIFVSVS